MFYKSRLINLGFSFGFIDFYSKKQYNFNSERMFLLCYKNPRELMIYMVIEL